MMLVPCALSHFSTSRRQDWNLQVDPHDHPWPIALGHTHLMDHAQIIDRQDASNRDSLRNSYVDWMDLNVSRRRRGCRWLGLPILADSVEHDLAEAIEVLASCKILHQLPETRIMAVMHLACFYVRHELCEVCAAETQRIGQLVLIQLLELLVLPSPIERTATIHRGLRKQWDVDVDECLDLCREFRILEIFQHLVEHVGHRHRAFLCCHCKTAQRA
mmetsp:Transcript_3432/g.6173  ORF Transcript_3432/g.6173 Transcript_3432/m.6173 type:complete len:217 (+) Transcript_3432:3-653(+)